MSIKSTQTITRAEAIARIKYIANLLEEGLYDEGEDYELNRKLAEAMDTNLFRLSEFENYDVVKNLYNT